MRSSTSKSVSRSDLPLTGTRAFRAAIAVSLAVGGAITAGSCRYADASELDFSTVQTELLGSTETPCDGLVFGPDGTGYLSSGSTVYRFDPAIERDAEASVTLVPWAETGAPRGHVVLASGEHVLCDGARVLRVTSDGEPLDGLLGAGLACPRDVCVAPGGEGVYVVDAGDTASSGSLVFLSLQSGEATRLDDGLEQPIAIALSPSGRTLYVVESASARLLAYELSGATSVGSRDALATLPRTDGGPRDVCVDADGFLWVACGGGVEILRSDGRSVARVKIPAASSLAFGGGSLRVLYFTSGTGSAGGVLGRCFPGVRGLPTRRKP